MWRKKDYYFKVLKNNKDFLKLSFLPMTFIITILGFYFTITGFKVQKIQLRFNEVQNSINQLFNYNNINLIQILVKSLILMMFILVFLYIVSLPIQAMSYFIIAVIQYFSNYGESYKKTLKKYFIILRDFINIIRR